MINFFKRYRISLLLISLLAVIHFSSKDFNNPWQKPITGDAQGYYAYLPAIFIYQDLDYSFTSEIEEKHYAPGLTKSFVKEVNGQKVNKTFPGVALLYLPFFLLAHGFALVSGLEADGYSMIYQVFFDLGFWVWFFLGLVYAQKVLMQLNVAEKTVALALPIVILTTGFVFYSVYDISTTHIHNFFLINSSLYFFLKYSADQKRKHMLLFAVFFSILVITRPTNLLAIFVFPVFLDLSIIKSSFISFINRFYNVLFLGLILLLAALVPLLLWKIQTGSWIVYSYGEEGFNFAQPQIYNFLFSTLKGWFVYSPFSLFILSIGFLFLFKISKKRSIFLLVFYLLSVYIFSSWWCWYYGAGMGQRVMLDSSILLIFLLALILPSLSRKWIKAFLGTATVFFVFLNFAQAWQIKEGILPNGTPTPAAYLDNFLVFEKKARVYPYDHWELESSVTPVLPGNGTISVDGTHSYSEILVVPEISVKKGSKIILTFNARALTAVTESRIIFKIESAEASEVFTFYLKDWNLDEEWTLMQFLIEPRTSQTGECHIFLWNASSGEQIEVKAVEVKKYYTDQYY